MRGEDFGETGSFQFGALQGRSAIAEEGELVASGLKYAQGFEVGGLGQDMVGEFGDEALVKRLAGGGEMKMGGEPIEEDLPLRVAVLITKADFIEGADSQSVKPGGDCGGSGEKGVVQIESDPLN